jgi:signal transduction histidine kinase
MNLKTKKNVFIGLIGFIILIGILHYVTPGYMSLFHDTFRRISYFPIAVGAIIYGLPGGITLAILSCLSFIPHLFMFWAQGPEAYYSELSEIIFYLAAGMVIGFISSRENRLKKKLADSYNRLHEQAKKLVEAEKLLGQSQKLATLGHVSASLAHEIKNPLASIKGTAEILADEVPKGHPKHEFVEIMRSEVARLNSSVEDVLQYCRGQQNASKIKLEPIGSIIDKVISLIDAQIKKKQIKLMINPNINANADPNKSQLDFLSDSSKMTQVLLNILLNAVDAVENHGRITIDHFAENRGYKIIISDNGPGISEKIKKDLFKPFVTYKDGGHGLGLSISKKLLNSFEGDITLTDHYSKGAQFNIFIPDIKVQAGLL